MTEREDMEKAFPPMFSNLNLVVVAGYGPVGFRREHGSAYGAAFHLVPALADLGVQGRVQRENGGPKPPAHKNIFHK